MIKDGLIQEDTIYGAPFTKHLIPRDRGKVSLWTPIKPEFITVHNDDSTGMALTNYVDNVEDRYVSWHFTVSDLGIYQELPIINNGWHCGDGKGPKSGNMTSIGVEICTKGNWKKARENGIKLVCYLMREVEWLVGDNWDMTIVPHGHWIKKDCPKKINAEKGGFEKFKSDCKSLAKSLENMTSMDIRWESILKRVSPKYASKVWVPWVRANHIEGKLNLKGLIVAIYEWPVKENVGLALALELIHEIVEKAILEED